jgi:hypothetical protein
MKFYKNVDLKDLQKILTEGLLPISKTNNNNWDCGKRSNNSTEVVYLFKPVAKENSFPQYGLALIEVDINNALTNEIEKNDVNFGRYEEYITSNVIPSNITAVYVPEIFKNRIVAEELLDVAVFNKINFCKIEAKNYNNDLIEEDTTPDTFLNFAKTAPLNTTDFNYFRGTNKDNTIIDLYNVVYNF